MIIDPGDGAKEILKSVRELGLNIEYIVLTHGHLDHIGALREVQEATGAEVAVHSDEAKLFQGRYQSLGAMFGLSYPVPSHPDRLLKDGDTLDVGDLHFSVLHTPGHSPGGICLLGEGVVFSGDTLFNYGIGRTDFLGGSYDQLINSIQTKLMTLPDNTRVYPGHGPPTTIGAERKSNPFIR
jgi:glyoxylase-like metal-dependent hydrolase (beta-lactamase superfamily II)